MGKVNTKNAEKKGGERFLRTRKFYGNCQETPPWAITAFSGQFF